MKVKGDGLSLRLLGQGDEARGIVEPDDVLATEHVIQEMRRESGSAAQVHGEAQRARRSISEKRSGGVGKHLGEHPKPLRGDVGIAEQIGRTSPSTHCSIT
jgi:hypothetical protein